MTSNIVQVVTSNDVPNQIVITTSRAPGVQQFIYQVQVFTVPGVLNTGAGRARFYIPGPITLSNVRASVSSAPIGASIVIDVNKNGSTVFTTNLKPTIYVGEVTCPTATPNITELVAGDYLSVDIDAVGSIFAGSDLTIQIELTP
jgi:hypothetical protein